MSAKVNNGVRIGDVDLLITSVPHGRGPRRTILDLVLSVALESAVDSLDWVLSVHPITSGEVAASRQFGSKRRAEQARRTLVAVAEAADDVSTFDWATHLNQA